MATVVKTKSALKKRLERFFFDKSSSRAELNNFLTQLNEVADVYIFGGVVRDIALKGIREFDSDIDVVIETKSAAFDELILSLNPSSNKFGGYRLVIGDWSLDIWEASKSWAFVNGEKNYSSVNSLLGTTITNWDSVIFDWSKKQLIVQDNYLSDLYDGFLHVVNDKNYNELGMLVRLLRFCMSPEVKTISPKTAEVISLYLSKHTYKDICDLEGKSYTQVVITSTYLTHLKNEVNLGASRNEPIALEKFNITKELL